MSVIIEFLTAVAWFAALVTTPLGLLRLVAHITYNMDNPRANLGRTRDRMHGFRKEFYPWHWLGAAVVAWVWIIAAWQAP